MLHPKQIKINRMNSSKLFGLTDLNECLPLQQVSPTFFTNELNLSPSSVIEDVNAPTCWDTSKPPPGYDTVFTLAANHSYGDNKNVQSNIKDLEAKVRKQEEEIKNLQLACSEQMTEQRKQEKEMKQLQLAYDKKIKHILNRVTELETKTATQAPVLFDEPLRQVINNLQGYKVYEDVAFKLECSKLMKLMREWHWNGKYNGPSLKQLEFLRDISSYIGGEDQLVQWYATYFTRLSSPSKTSEMLNDFVKVNGVREKATEFISKVVIAINNTEIIKMTNVEAEHLKDINTLCKKERNFESIPSTEQLKYVTQYLGDKESFKYIMIMVNKIHRMLRTVKVKQNTEPMIVVVDLATLQLENKKDFKQFKLGIIDCYPTMELRFVLLYNGCHQRENGVRQKLGIRRNDDKIKCIQVKTDTIPYLLAAWMFVPIKDVAIVSNNTSFLSSDNVAALLQTINTKYETYPGGLSKEKFYQIGELLSALAHSFIKVEKKDVPVIKNNLYGSLDNDEVEFLVTLPSSTRQFVKKVCLSWNTWQHKNYLVWMHQYGVYKPQVVSI